MQLEDLIKEHQLTLKLLQTQLDSAALELQAIELIFKADYDRACKLTVKNFNSDNLHLAIAHFGELRHIEQHITHMVAASNGDPDEFLRSLYTKASASNTPNGN